MANALLSNSKTKHPSGYTWSSYILIPGQHSNFGPITPSQKQTARSNQLFRAITSQTGTAHGIQEYFKNKEASYTEHLSLFKDVFFFPYWILIESSITEQFCAVFPLPQTSIELCITTYDNVFQTFLRCSPFCLISLPATLPFLPALLLPWHQHLYFSWAGEQKQAVITACKYLLTPTS